MFLFIVSCFGGGVDKKGSVVKYKSGVVYTEGGAFSIGVPSAHWIKSPFRFRAILFKNQDFPASMSVSSFCRGSFDEAPLPILSKQAFYDLSNPQTLATKNVSLNGRAAIRVVKKGSLDGASLLLDIVTLKMNACVFDFILTSDQQHYKKIVGDFENFYGGFKYLHGPEI
ncbi:MAG: hypothetical protein ACD_73C00633G0001, partial [uncultured bacterium]